MDKEKDVCYVVEAHEGIEWVPKARYNFEDTETFLVLAKNPFYRILKDGKDITSKYKQDSGKLQSNNNNSIVYDNSSSQIDSKLSSVYKYQGAVSIPLWLPIANQNVGDVYNIHNGHTSKAIKEFTGATLTSVNYKYSDNVKIITATFDGISDSGFGKVNSYIGLVLDCSPINDNYSVDGKIIGIEGSTFIIDASAGTAKDSTDPGNSWTIVDGFTTLPVSIKSGRYSSSYVQTFNDGANVVWTGTTWDELGTTVDISAKVSNNATKPLKPAEYKAMSSECKQKLKADIQRMLDEKTKRNDIFHALNISESTYDIIRTEMKKDESVNKSDVIEPKLNKSARKGTLLGR